MAGAKLHHLISFKSCDFARMLQNQGHYAQDATQEIGTKEPYQLSPCTCGRNWKLGFQMATWEQISWGHGNLQHNQHTYDIFNQHVSVGLLLQCFHKSCGVQAQQKAKEGEVFA